MEGKRDLSYPPLSPSLPQCSINNSYWLRCPSTKIHTFIIVLGKLSSQWSLSTNTHKNVVHKKTLRDKNDHVDSVVKTIIHISIMCKPGLHSNDNII